jgi:lysine 2,3-aminomutase
MASADAIHEVTESADGKLKAVPPEQRTEKPPIASGSLEHRELRDDKFWQQIPEFSDTDRETFKDYMWQMKNSVYGVDQLVERVEDIAPEEFIEDLESGFQMAPMAVRITPYLLSLIDWQNPWEDPIRRQFIPLGSQLQPDHPMLTLDSLHEQKDAPVEGLTHRYLDKALFLVLDTCPVYCRFCTRSYAVGVDTDTVEKVKLRVNPDRWEKAFEYIRSRPELEDLVISGGDTYNMPAKHLRYIGETLLDIDHVRRIRFATKGLAVMPVKVLSDDDWFDAITDIHDKGRRMHKEVCIHTHFNHPNEITELSREASNKLFEAGVKVRNQCVLQRGVNDSPEIQQFLTKQLAEINVQPYYVFQHDMVKGVEDLRTPVSQTMEIEKNVRGLTAGFNTPMMVVDAPGGGGKRDIHSWEHYNEETGVSVYRAPPVRPDEYFMYFDPMHSLSEEVQEAWRDEDKQEQMCEDALRKARQ